MWEKLENFELNNGDIIDCWVAFIDPDNGIHNGFRLCNCWVHDGRIVHGQQGVELNFVTHCMNVPERPPLNEIHIAGNDDEQNQKLDS